MISLLEKFIPVPYRWFGQLMIVAFVFAAGWVVNGWRWNSKVQNIKISHVQEINTAVTDNLRTSEIYRKKEQQLSAKIQEAQDGLKIETDRNIHIIAGLRADRDLLRKSVASFAVPDNALTDTASACRGDTATLGNVLADTLYREEEFARAAETHATGVRSLLEAWPDNR